MPFLPPSFLPLYLFSDKFILCSTLILIIGLPYAWSGDNARLLPLIFGIYGQANIYELSSNFAVGLLVVGSVLHLAFVKWQRRNVERRQEALLEQSSLLDTYALQYMAKKQRNGVDNAVAQTLATSLREVRDNKKALAAVVALAEVMVDAATKLEEVDRKIFKNLTQRETHSHHLRKSFTAGQVNDTTAKAINRHKVPCQRRSDHGATLGVSRTNTATPTPPETKHFNGTDTTSSDELVRKMVERDEFEITIHADANAKFVKNTEKNYQGDGCRLDEMKDMTAQPETDESFELSRADSKAERGDLLQECANCLSELPANAYTTGTGGAHKLAKETHEHDEDRVLATVVRIPASTVDETQLQIIPMQHIDNIEPKTNVLQSIHELELPELKTEETILGRSKLIGEELRKLYLIYTTRKSFDTEGKSKFPSIENQPLKNNFRVAQKSLRTDSKETTQREKPPKKMPRSSILRCVKQGKKQKQVTYWDENEEDIIRRLPKVDNVASIDLKPELKNRPCNRYQRTQRSAAKFGCQLYISESNDRLFVPDQKYIAPEIEKKRDYDGTFNRCELKNMPNVLSEYNSECAAIENVTQNGFIIQGQRYGIPEMQVSTDKSTDFGLVNYKCGSDVCKFQSLKIKVSKPSRPDEKNKAEQGRSTVKKDGFMCDSKKSIQRGTKCRQKSWKQDCSPTFITIVSDDDSIFEEPISNVTGQENLDKMGLIEANNKVETIASQKVDDNSLETQITQYRETDPNALDKFIYYERTYNTPTPQRYYSKKIGFIMSEIIQKSKMNRSTRSNIEMKKAHVDSSADMQISEMESPTSSHADYEDFFEFDAAQESLYTEPKPGATRVKIHMLDTKDMGAAALGLRKTNEPFNTGMICRPAITVSKKTKPDIAVTRVELQKRTPSLNKSESEQALDCKTTTYCETEQNVKSNPITKTLRTKTESAAQKPQRTVKFDLSKVTMDKTQANVIRKRQLSPIKSDVKRPLIEVNRWPIANASQPNSKLDKSVEVKSKPELLMPNTLGTVRRMIPKPLFKPLAEVKSRPQRNGTSKVMPPN